MVTHPTDYFFSGADLWRTLYVWEGGLAIFGAILFGGLGAYIACRRAGLRFLSFADALAPGMLLAQSFGRLGNYFNLAERQYNLRWGKTLGLYLIIVQSRRHTVSEPSPYLPGRQ